MVLRDSWENIDAAKQAKKRAKRVNRMDQHLIG
jgi:hypothetical protein